MASILCSSGFLRSLLKSTDAQICHRRMTDSSGVDTGIHFLISLSVGAADEPTSRAPIKVDDIIFLVLSLGDIHYRNLKKLFPVLRTLEIYMKHSGIPGGKWQLLNQMPVTPKTCNHPEKHSAQVELLRTVLPMRKAGCERHVTCSGCVTTLVGFSRSVLSDSL